MAERIEEERFDFLEQVFPEELLVLRRRRDALAAELGPDSSVDLFDGEYATHEEPNFENPEITLTTDHIFVPGHDHLEVESTEGFNAEQGVLWCVPHKGPGFWLTYSGKAPDRFLGVEAPKHPGNRPVPLGRGARVFEAGELAAAHAPAGSEPGDEPPEHIFVPPPMPQSNEWKRPSVELGTMGIALSGGGIRSATFNLGVLQGLHKYGMFRFADYLSTVSGGGYLGTAVSTLMAEPGATFPFQDVSDTVKGHDERDRIAEPAALLHLRNHSNYLTPDGPFDWFRVASVLVRGIVINLMILSPLVVFGAAAVAMLYGSSIVGLGADASMGAVRRATVQLVPYTALATLALFCISPMLRNIASRIGRATTGKGETLWAAALVVNLLALALDAQPFLVHAFHHKLRALSGGGFPVEIGGLVAILSAVGSLAAGRASAAGAVGKVVGPWIVALIGLAVPVLLFLISADLIIYADPGWGQIGLKDVLDSVQVWWMEFLGKSGELGGELRPVFYQAFLSNLAAGLVAVAVWLVVDVNDHSFHRYYRDALSRTYILRTRPDEHRRREDPEIESGHPVRFSATSQRGSLAPYHIINTTLNLQGDKRLRTRGRQADFFIMSKRFCGSESTGYVPTEVLEQTMPDFSIATAMAISAAAASPNMGPMTMSSLVRVMALLNVRLGYWFPHPTRIWARGQRAIRDWSAASREAPEPGGPSPRQALVLQAFGGWARNLVRPRSLYFLREMRGSLTADTHSVNLSDGGHLENLGAIELLRRRCRYIIVSDGEADAEMKLGALATLQRIARLDLGVEIDIDVSELRLDESGRTRRHAAFGIVHYPADAALRLKAETGLILYVKSSLTGDEDAFLDNYKAGSADFPHETTADQFFDEAQFEAYRALGFHIMDHLLGIAARGEVRSQSRLNEVFKRIAVVIEPDSHRLGAGGWTGRRLERIEELLAIPLLRPLAMQLPPVENATSPSTALLSGASEYRYQLLQVVNAMLELMETVFVDLRLDEIKQRKHSASAGWMNRFRRWASAPDFRWAYAVSIHSYAKAFRNFCDYALKLDYGLVWRAAQGEGPWSDHESDAPRGPDRRDDTRSWVALAAVGEDASAPIEPHVPIAWVVTGVHQGPAGEPAITVVAHGLYPGFEEAETYTRLVTSMARWVGRRRVRVTRPDAEAFRMQLESVTLSDLFRIAGINREDGEQTSSR